MTSLGEEQNTNDGAAEMFHTDMCQSSIQLQQWRKKIWFDLCKRAVQYIHTSSPRMKKNVYIRLYCFQCCVRREREWKRWEGIGCERLKRIFQRTTMAADNSWLFVSFRVHTHKYNRINQFSDFRCAETEAHTKCTHSFGWTTHKYTRAHSER